MHGHDRWNLNPGRTPAYQNDVKPIVSIYSVESNAGSLGLRVEKARGFSVRPIQQTAGRLPVYLDDSASL